VRARSSCPAQTQRKAASEEQRPGRLLAQEFQGAHLAVYRLDVERLAGYLQAPQVGLQPCAGIQDMGGDLVQSRGQRPAHIDLAGSPVCGEGGVEAVRHQFRGAGALGMLHRLVGELDGARRLAGVCPAAGERGRQPCPCRVVGRAGQHVVQLGGQLSRLGPEQVNRGRTEHRLGPPVEIARRAGLAEEITDSGRDHHTFIVGFPETPRPQVRAG
jgi:hypothetical protein